MTNKKVNGFDTRADSVAECSSKDGRLANPKTWDEWTKIIPKPSDFFWTGRQFGGRHDNRYNDTQHNGNWHFSKKLAFDEI
jgi:hypothetical protein